MCVSDLEMPSMILMPLTSRLNAGMSAISISAMRSQTVAPKTRVLPQGRYDALHVAPFAFDHHDAAYPIGGFRLLQPHREPGNDAARN
jgi:hypothetical protein